MRGKVVTFAWLVAKPWQKRTLEGSGGSGARFWTRGFCVGGSRIAKPCQGRTLEGSGGSSARFWTCDFAWKGCHFWPWQGRTLQGCAGSGASFCTRGFWTLGFAWKCRHLRVVTFVSRAAKPWHGLEGRETLAGAYSRGLWQ